MVECDFKICAECNGFLNEIHQFIVKSKLIESMFEEIQQVENSLETFTNQEELLEAKEFVQAEHDQNVNKIREKFGLPSTIEDAIQPMTITNLFDEGALEIKLENDEFGVPDALAENQEISDSSEEEEESEIDDLSDKNELKFREESSDSGPDERKRERKKYKKSEEEKLFE
jgi:hypothetical protein